MINLRLVLVFAALAAVLVLISGLFGRVGFIDILLRILVWGIVFGGMGAGIGILLKKYLPELSDDGQKPALPKMKEEKGSNLDVTVSDDDDFVFTSDGTESAPEYQNEDVVIEGNAGDFENSGDSEYNSEDSFDDGIEEAQSADDEPSDVDGQIDYGSEVQTGTVGDLGDIGEFEGIFSDGNDEIESTGSTGRVKIGNTQEDPIIAAKAVKTMLKRDGER